MAVKGARPTILGVVNLTEDSFSDAGLFLDPGKALEHARQLVLDGADVIDLGPASSHPDSQKVSAEEEIRRLRPVVEELRAEGVQLSIDSYQLETQRYAIEQGVAYLNDIQAFAAPELYPELARARCRLIVMHSVQRRGPATRVETNAGSVYAGIEPFFAQRLLDLTQAGVDRERIILDPGMGFFLGATPGPSIEVLSGLRRLMRSCGAPMLISVSRKSFLGELSGRDVAGRGAATLAAELFAAEQGVDFIRTHDVRALCDGLAVQRRLRKTEEG